MCTVALKPPLGKTLDLELDLLGEHRSHPQPHAGPLAVGELDAGMLERAPDRLEIGWPERQKPHLEIRHQRRRHDGV